MESLDDLEAQERDKYLNVWGYSSYRNQADGAPVVDRAFELMGCKPGETLIDWGCGTGLPAAQLAALGLVVTGFDIAANCLNEGIDIPLVVGCLWSPPAGLEADYGFSTDVMEHIPPDAIDLAFDAIAARTRKAAYIQVDTAPDISGPRMNPPTTLHLTVEPSEWWTEQLRARWREVTLHPGTFSRVGFLCLK